MNLGQDWSTIAENLHLQIAVIHVKRLCDQDAVDLLLGDLIHLQIEIAERTICNLCRKS